MRLVIDTLVALMLAGVLAGVVLHHRSDDEQMAEQRALRENVREFQRQITLQTTIRNCDLSAQGFPAVIDTEWFNGILPSNPLLTDNRPWVEIAGSDQIGWQHPPDRIAHDPDAAAFWYNPSNGIVRARVPAMLSETRAREIYDYVNGLSDEPAPADTPLSNARRSGPMLTAASWAAVRAGIE